MANVDKFLTELLDDLNNNRLVLPTLPEVALRVRDAVEDDDVSASQIADIVATDAALSARLMQVANSPLYRGQKPIENLQTAVSRLGFQMVRNLVSSLVMQQIFQPTTDVLDQRLRALWEHSTQVAAISRVLAAHFTRLQADQAMLAGLIHDIGALPILVRAEDMPELLTNAATLDQVVQKLHPIVGKAILENWEFPATLVAVAAEHEDLQRDPGGNVDYVDVVIAANLQSHLGTSHPSSQVDWNTVPAFQRLGIEPDVSVVEMDAHSEEIDEVHRLLNS